jgi:ParB/RepB/Spo0J family partition protein
MPTSSEFHVVLLDQIIIERDQRQRRTLDGIEDLAESIKRLGLIHPIVLTREHVLVVGERRLEACRILGWTSIPFQFIDELDSLELESVELEENVKRADLTWQDLNDAYSRIHEIAKLRDPKWTQERTAERLGVTRALITQHMQVKAERANPLVNESKTFRNAERVASGIRERRAADEFPSDPLTVNEYIQVCDFREWAQTYTGQPFNFIHCDFPYGINADKSDQAAVKALGGYSDTKEIYFELMKTLSVELDRFCAPSAHMIFWFSAIHYSATWELLKLLDGFQFDEYPLIWMKDDNKGIAPDQTRRPRRLYEMAFFGWRGDRRIIRLKNNIITAPTVRERHPHEKSELALKHFFEMVVDSSTRLLDPTCGSGSALRAADSLGAAQVLGLERDSNFADGARIAFEAARRNRGASAESVLDAVEI